MSLSAKSHVKTLLENKLRVHFVLFFFLSSFEKAFTGYTEEKPLAVYISPPTFRSLFLKISTQHSEHRDNCWVHTCCCAVGKPEGSLHTAWMPMLACKNKAHFYWRLYLLFNFFPPSPFFFFYFGKELANFSTILCTSYIKNVINTCCPNTFKMKGNSMLCDWKPCNSST